LRTGALRGDIPWIKQLVQRGLKLDYQLATRCPGRSEDGEMALLMFLWTGVWLSSLSLQLQIQNCLRAKALLSHGNKCFELDNHL
jgi:hypothetical protein